MDDKEICEHEKVYADYALMSCPPQYPWICEKCGTEGIDTIKSFKILNEYNAIRQYFNNK